MATNVTLWVNSDPFTFGTLQVSPHPKLSLHYLKKIDSYVKTKGDSGFPRLSFPVWKHIACNKLTMAEDLAWMYFEGFDLLCHYEPEERLQQAERYRQCKTKKEQDSLRNQTSVDTLQFLLYLFIQQVHKISLRSTLMTGEEWPTRARSPDISGKTSSTSKGLDENTCLSFVLNNLNDLMLLLTDTITYSGTTNDVLLTIDSVKALGLLISGSYDGCKTVHSLHEVTLQQQVQVKCGYSKISQTFSFRAFESWLRSNLADNPFGVGNCVASGRRLSWPTTGCDSEGKPESGAKRGRVATNAHFTTRDQKLIIISQVCKQTLAKMSTTLTNSRVKVHRCHYAFMYLLSPMKYVSIEKCRHSTIVLGPVATTVHVTSCEDITIIAPCRRFSISGSTLCTAHLMTPTRPLILGGNDSITLAPYHTNYSMLEDHMATSGLATLPNVWNKPLCVGPDHQEGSPVYSFLSPEEFFMFVIPFEMEGDTKEFPGSLPSKYENALVTRQKQIKDWQRTVKEAKLNPAQKQQFQTLVESRFQAWLLESGHKRQVDGLVPVPSSPTK
ncbi:TBCC domain-containing protein 1-like isoform X2 [Anneissia japonica]|uniref:TBCC domain-containing protein 1-like isoform X2 n=1 Tax=Anneissia japonica TaxID=1529436 RepID=UPI001425662B|nr:TBCC domain-containing protein 1-like isoform X2 [Anneissia japonica]